MNSHQDKTVERTPAAHDVRDEQLTNHLHGMVIRHIFAGNSLTYQIQWKDEILRIFMQNLSGDILSDGTTINLSWKPSDTVVVLDE